MGKLNGKIAIITGSDSGIGQAMATAFAREGADVAVTWHTDEDGAQITAERVRQAGGRSLVCRLEVTDEASVQALFRAVDEQLGVPDILVNDAGVGKSKAFTELTYEDFDRVLKTDLYGPFLCAREFVRRRQNAGGGGTLLNVTSVHDAIPSPNNVAYGAAKGGLLLMTRSLAMELAPLKINVNAIAPGLIRTPMTMQRVDDPAQREQEMPHIPWHRPGQPEEVAELALYLVGPDADYITGQDFVIDGGLEMNWGQGA
ncbi:SDR family oxidoreductase [Pseudomonas lopnurensis]|uniref:SDR family oxidoreductase n=1 Tax=Pseudomonas lopnurensis TaxID=1477517 RepID=UPI001879042F|nr:SDR family oxidoreductase [Pseudomonas lopnurensis]MBE7373367.1 SDR family oxidoreductase [Pseudomonas lopnurensis]